MTGLVCRVIFSRDPDSLDLDHPTGTEARQDGVDLRDTSLRFGVGRTFAIRPGKIPAGHQRAVLQENDAVVDQARIRDEIGKGRTGMAERLEATMA